MTEGAQSVPLTIDRAKQLMELGFDWTAKDPTMKPWEKRFEELCAFKVLLKRGAVVLARALFVSHSLPCFAFCRVSSNALGIPEYQWDGARTRK
jgi:hypothetical protein